MPEAFLVILKNTTLCNEFVFFSFIIVLYPRWPIESKFSQVCYFMRMLGHTKWEYLSLTITKGVQCVSICLAAAGVNIDDFACFYIINSGNNKIFTWLQYRNRHCWMTRMFIIYYLSFDDDDRGLLKNTGLHNTVTNFWTLFILDILGQSCRGCVNFAERNAKLKTYDA